MAMNDIAFFDPIGPQGHAQDVHPERPEGLQAVKQPLQRSGSRGMGKQIKALGISPEQLESIHSQPYLKKLQELSLAGKNYDAETYLTKKSWDLALQAAGGTIALVKQVWERKSASGFALSRPPGHHATIDQAMGFCLINNVAAGADYIIKEKNARRIAIIDLDVHHGNGTQDIFWSRDDVFFFSIHQSPLYPGSGHISEVGQERGKGFTLNIPYPLKSGNEAYLAALDEIILPKLKTYSPNMILISFGFDGHWRDPLANMLLSAQGYFQLFEKLKNFADANCDGKIAVILEGGYDLEAASSCGLAITQALLGEQFVDELGEAPFPESDDWERVLAQIKRYWHL